MSRRLLIGLAFVALMASSCAGSAGSGTTSGDDIATTGTSGPDSNELAEGSGCTPGAGDLPDGDWFGFVTDRGEGSIEFDLACWFTGDAAILASAEDGEESPPPNDYYVRNVNAETRSVPLGAEVEVVFYPDGDPNHETTVAYADWSALVEERGYELGVWLEIRDGVIAAIAEKWVP
jgi:hypothetical protein